MRCLIILIDPDKNEVVKEAIVGNSYKDASAEVSRLNEKLQCKPNKKGLYWKVQSINV
jgi:hypothetical protein